VVRSIDRCGVSFLKAAAKTGIEICRGLGGTSQECREIKDIVKPDIDWWRAAGKQERADCNADMQTLCLSRCQSVVSLYDSLLPSQLRPTEVREGGGIEGGVTLEAIRMTSYPLLVPQIPEGGVREGAVDAITFLETPRSP
jgi:hypothetical protein